MAQLSLWADGEDEGTAIAGGGPGAWWRGYTPDTGAEPARAAFRLLYGCEPAEVRVAPGVLLLGPVPTARVRAQAAPGEGRSRSRY